MTGLLERYAPVLLYDLLEPDTAGDVTRIVGEVRRGSGTPVMPYEPSALADGAYPDGQLVLKGDHIAMRRHDCGPGVTYARELEQAGATWLTYWWWYCRNGFHWSTGGWHFGDWEGVVLRVPAGADEPDLAAYSQHRAGEARPWDRVRLRDGRPLVFVALGSHASRFDRSPIATGLRSPGDLAVERVSEDTHRWLRWPGRWGQSVAGGRWADSPRGPAQHAQWNHPAEWVAGLTTD